MELCALMQVWAAIALCAAPDPERGERHSVLAAHANVAVPCLVKQAPVATAAGAPC